eukprot:SAG31_NODE_924_length_10963_cov_4.339286_10_plen_84_part_00
MLVDLVMGWVVHSWWERDRAETARSECDEPRRVVGWTGLASHWLCPELGQRYQRHRQCYAGCQHARLRQPRVSSHCVAYMVNN